MTVWAFPRGHGDQADTRRGDSLLDEKELVTRASRGNVDAFGDLFNRYATDVFRVALALGCRRGEAEDLMQDTFLAAFEGIGRFERRASFKTWLLAILMRQAGRLRRYKNIRKTEVFDETAVRDTQDNGGVRLQENHESRLDAHTMLESLSPEHRAVLVLRELQGLSYNEIAQALNLPRGTVESRLFRARAVLRERFHDYGNPRDGQLPARETVEARHE